MDLFRSKKRGSESASLGDVPDSLQKRHRNMSGSVDVLLEGADDSQDEVFSDVSTSESETEDVQKASKMQKIFAKKLIKRDKRKEKEHRKKVEKNLISMDDFLGKQSEFKMWLYEEKSKNAGSLSSPKLKAYFKQFMRLWNKHKLVPKYYKSSTLPDSPRTPLAQREFNFLSEGSTSVSGLQPPEANGVETKKDPPTSPFVTFGKTPPKVFKSKKLQLFPSNHDVALISVVPLDSPTNVAVSNKENPKQDEPCQYRVPSVKSRKQSNNQLETPSPQFIGATPYKVSVFSWAVGDSTDCDADQSLEVCSTQTPPNLTHTGSTDKEDWPPPPSETELNCQSTSDSPHVPPPPPPRVESLPKSGNDAASVKSDGSDYTDPYDKIQDKPVFTKHSGHYQDPVDCIIAVDSNHKREVNPEVKLVLKTFNSSNDEPDMSMYSKPVNDKPDMSMYSKPVNDKPDMSMYSKPVNDKPDMSMYSKPVNGKPDMSMYSKPVNDKRPSKEELEEMYAKPIKKHKKSEVVPHISQCNKVDVGSSGGLYAEIMAHLDNRKLPGREINNKQGRKPDPDYECIDEVVVKVGLDKQDANSLTKEEINKPGTDNTSTNVIDQMKKLPEFSGLAKNKKKTVLAASSDKIYETYLKLGGKINAFKSKQTGSNMETGIDASSACTLKKRHKSQPDISFSDNLQLFENDDCVSDRNGRVQREKPFLSSFQPVDKLYTHGRTKEYVEASCPKLNKQQRAQSCEENLGAIETPRTPIIMSTPSFESLCQVTPLSNRSRSSQSLPNKSSLSDNLSGSDSFMSTSTTSSISIGPNEHSGSVQSLHSERSLSPVPEEDDEKDAKEPAPFKRSDKMTPCGVGALTPGKINAARHGIDLSVYLLKPNHQVEHSNTEIKPEHTDGETAQDHTLVNSEAQTNCKSKMFDTQSRLAFKDTLSGLKTKVDPSQTGNKKEVERRHTVQTIQEMKEGYIIQKKPEVQNHVPNIGVASKHRKLESGSKSLKSTWEQGTVPGEVREPDSKRHCGEKEPLRVDKDQYLETDIDSVIQEKPKQWMKKSKSHSGFSTGASSTVVTDIW